MVLGKILYIIDIYIYNLLLMRLMTQLYTFNYKFIKKKKTILMIVKNFSGDN